MIALACALCCRALRRARCDRRSACAAGRLARAIATAGARRVRRGDWPSEEPPRPLAARPVKFPPYEIRKLPNGLQVVLVSHHEQPSVSVRMIVRAGAAQDPKGKMGLAMLTATLLDQGAGKRTAEQIADRSTSSAASSAPAPAPTSPTSTPS